MNLFVMFSIDVTILTLLSDEISKLSEKLKSDYNLEPANLLSKIEELRKEFNENTQIIKTNLEKLDNKDE